MSLGKLVTLVPLMGGDAADIALPTENLLALWYAGNGSKDHASISGGDGNPVTAWADSGSNGYDLTQATEAAQPTYHRKLAAFNNRGAVEFDGDDYLQRTIAAGIAANEAVCTILIVGITNGGAQYLYNEGYSVTSTPRVNFHTEAAGSLRYQHTDDSGLAMTRDGAITTGEKIMLVGRRADATSFYLRVNGVQGALTTKAIGTTTIDILALGALAVTTLRAGFLIGHLAVVAVYGADNFATIEPIAADFYGITLP